MMPPPPPPLYVIYRKHVRIEYSQHYIVMHLKRSHSVANLSFNHYSRSGVDVIFDQNRLCRFYCMPNDNNRI